MRYGSFLHSLFCFFICRILLQDRRPKGTSRRISVQMISFWPPPRVSRRVSRRFASQRTKFWLLPARSRLEQPWPVRLRLRMETSCHVGKVMSPAIDGWNPVKSKAVIQWFYGFLWYIFGNSGFFSCFSNSSHVMSWAKRCHAQQKNTPAG